MFRRRRAASGQMPEGYVPPHADLDEPQYDYVERTPARERAFAPHCDQSILHAPGTCEHCDLYPDWQKLRDLWGVNFTNELDIRKAPCPSTWFREPAVRDRWGGNIAKPRS